MDRLRPRSLLFLLLMGYACLALPLGFGLHTADGFLRSLGDDAERLLHQGVETARRARVVVEVVEDMQRNARQFGVLKDAALMDVYDQRHVRLMVELSLLEESSTTNELAKAVQELRTHADSVHGAMGRARRDVTGLDETLSQFEHLGALARRLELLGSGQFNQTLSELGENADAARDSLLLQSVVLVPIAIILAGMFSALVLRPVRALTHAIRLLGEGRLEGRVAIPGPTEVASLGHEIEWLRQRLVATEEEKQGFLRRMSHELKTPLASVREGSALLADGSVGVLDVRQHEVVDIMRESAARLEEQIDNLLAFSALTSAQCARVQQVRLDTTLAQVLRAHRLEIERKDLRVVHALAAVWVNFDAEQLRMVLNNVVGNAVKFLPSEGFVRISLRVQRERAILDLVDTGPGIAHDERELVFKPFYQGSSSHRAHLRGTGVGLCVVRECMAAHGASVRILDSAVGAHFRLIFPGAKRAR